MTSRFKFLNSHSKDTLLANFVQQCSGLFTFLIIPHLLDVKHYGEVTYVMTLLAFINLSDLGLSSVYIRSVPVALVQNNHQVVARWNASTLRLKFWGSLVFGMVIAGMYLYKYGDFWNAFLLFLTVPFLSVLTFGLASYIAQENFVSNRKGANIQSLTRLLIIPATWIGGLPGWFVGQLLAAALVIVNYDIKSQLIKSWGMRHHFDWSLIKSHLAEALSLGFTLTIWLQLLSVAKLYAVFSYPDDVIAQYGLVNTAYQIVGGMLIAAFVPVTVKTYRLFAQDERIAMDYMFRNILIVFPIVALLVGIGLVIAGPFFHIFFPKYGVSSLLTAPVLLSLLSYPSLIVLGGALVATRRHVAYLILVTFWLTAGYILFQFLLPNYGHSAAALAQFILLPLYSISLIVMVYIYLGRFLEHKWKLWCAVISNLIAPICYYIWLVLNG